jgi:twinkle protein
MAGIIPDTIDFSQYLRQTEAQLKVRPASVFADDVRASFAPRDRSQRHPSMFLAKLRDVLEFRPGEVTVWAGYNGHRKSMFTGQVALDLCMQRQRVLMASFEMQPARTIARMARQCLGVSQPAPTSIDAFSRWTDGRLWVFDHIGRISSDQCMAVSRYFAE